MKDSYLGQAWLVIVMSVSVGGALAGVYVTLNDRIQANAEADALARVPDLIAQADRQKTSEGTGEDVAIERADGTKTVYRVYRAVSAEGRPFGWVIRAGGDGFAGRIELLIAVDQQASRIVGLDVLDQKESPTVGDRIVSLDFRRRFFDPPKATGQPLKLVKDPPKAPDQVQAISGATISSRAVTDIVNRAVGDLRQELARRGRTPARNE